MRCSETSSFASQRISFKFSVDSLRCDHVQIKKYFHLGSGRKKNKQIQACSTHGVKHDVNKCVSDS